MDQREAAAMSKVEALQAESAQHCDSGQYGRTNLVPRKSPSRTLVPAVPTTTQTGVVSAITAFGGGVGVRGTDVRSHVVSRRTRVRLRFVVLITDTRRVLNAE